MVLEKILAAKREAVAARKQARPRVRFRVAAPSPPRGFASALRAAPCGFILECKGASPSAGELRFNYAPAVLACEYADVASCISVLTDQPFFGGTLEHLAQVREAVQQPVLCKDFIVDPYQVYEARSYGADAVLLMMSVLSDNDFRRCLDAVDDLGMDALVEVHDEEELARALELGATLIGINNRNLQTLEVSLDVTERLAPQVPPEIMLISESGIRDRGDVRRLRPLVDGFLVGSSLMRRDDLARAARELAYGRVKVCGLTNGEDAVLAWRSGATLGGLIFAPESPRLVTVQRALELREAVPQLRWVGVFVNEDPARVGRVAAQLDLAAVQLHGEESEAQVKEVREQVPAGCEVWRAHRVGSTGEALPTVEGMPVDRLLLDSYRAHQRGGTGERFDWSALDGCHERDRIIVAGGLTPETAAAADGLGVWALDVSSGIEQEPGRKSGKKLDAFFFALRALSGRGPRAGGDQP